MLKHHVRGNGITRLFLTILCTFCVLSKCVTSEHGLGIDFDNISDGPSLIRDGVEHSLANSKHNHDAITVTRIVYVNNPAETDVTQLGMCPTTSDFTPRQANPSSIKGRSAENGSYSRWLLALFQPIYLAKSVTLALFTYLFIPIFYAAIWAIRVLVFRPAIFIYLLFLERPFQALLSFVLWILPMLAFITAITLVAIVIGGSFGWFSAVAVGAIDAAIPDNTHPDTDDKGRHPAPSSIASIPQRVELVLRDVQNDFSDSKNAKTTSVQQQQPDIWTRRRGTALSSLRP